MKKTVSLLIIAYWLFSAFTRNSVNKINISDGWPSPTYSLPASSTDRAKVDLGRVLFYDPILSIDSSISCASCHSPFNAFAHTDHALSHGIHDSIGTRNAPGLMNLAWQSSFMWDGNIPHLDMQSLFPITHPREMGESIQHVIVKLQRSKGYQKLYATAYTDTVITGELTLKALSAFMLTIISNNAKYDSVMRKQSAFTAQEENGYHLYKKNCSSCHVEPLFSNFAFENNGLPQSSLLKDKGRMNVTGNAADSLKFKVPTLRNIEFSYPYMHDGRFKKISDVLQHYTTGIQKSSTLSTKLYQPIELSPNEKVDLTAFLLTLSDRAFLFNPAFSYPHKLMQDLAKK